MYYAAAMSHVGHAFAGLTMADRHPINPDDLRAEAGAPVENRRVRSEQHEAAKATAILEAWAQQQLARRV
jgi:guanine deaminase